MTVVRVVFDYEPDYPDEDDSTGMSEDEFERVFDAITHLGGMNIEMDVTE